MNSFDRAVHLGQLRECQTKAYRAIQQHFSSDADENHILVQLPTGTGKSALIAIMPFKVAKKKVLVLAPNLTLANQLEKDLNYADNPVENVYKKLGIFTDEELEDLEIYTLKLDSTANFGDIETHQIIVANYQQLGDIEKWFKEREGMVDLIIIDEAHHQKASTYQTVIKFFKGARVIGLTATPFRSDGQKVDGKNVYTYHFRDAIRNEYIRNIKVSNVTPQEVELSFSDTESQTYSLADILEMREEAWFRRGIALSQDCCNSIAGKAREKWEQLKKEFPRSSHQIIAAAISLRHAREFVKPAFERLGLKVGIVSSEYPKTTNAKTLKKLTREEIDVIVNIGMLGEGFDHNKLGVAVIFRPFASLNPYIQFVGRAIRKNDDVKHCFVVSHLGLNQTRRFDEFRLFDNDDQQFLENLLMTEETNGGGGGEVSFVDDDPDSKDSDGTVKIVERGSELIELESQFMDINQKNIIVAERAIANLSERERKILSDKIGIDYSVSESKRATVSPKNIRRAAKTLLHEKEKSAVTDIINALNLKMHDRNFNPTRLNFSWVSQKVGREINKRLGITERQRNDLSHETLKEFNKSDVLGKIEEECITYFRDKLKEKGAVMDIINALNLKVRDRDFDSVKHNSFCVSQKVSREINKRLGITRGQRNDLSHEKLKEFDKSGALGEIEEECITYFRGKLKER